MGVACRCDVSLRYVATGATRSSPSSMRPPRAISTYARIGFCLLLGLRAVPRAGRRDSWRRGRADRHSSFPRDLITRTTSDAASERFHRTFDRVGARRCLGHGGDARVRGRAVRVRGPAQLDRRAPTRRTRSPHGWPFHGRRAGAGSASGSSCGRGRPADGSSGMTAGCPVFDSDGGSARFRRSDLYRGRLSGRARCRPGGGFQELNAQRPQDLVGVRLDRARRQRSGARRRRRLGRWRPPLCTARIVAPGPRDVSRPTGPARPDLVPGRGRRLAGRGRRATLPSRRPARSAGASARPTSRRPGSSRAWRSAVPPEGPDALRYFDAALPPRHPAAGRAVARLRELAGWHVLAVTAPAPLAAIALADPRGADEVVLAVANTSPDSTSFRLPDGRLAELDGFTSRVVRTARGGLAGSVRRDRASDFGELSRIGEARPERDHPHAGVDEGSHVRRRHSAGRDESDIGERSMHRADPARGRAPRPGTPSASAARGRVQRWMSVAVATPGSVGRPASSDARMTSSSTPGLTVYDGAGARAPRRPARSSRPCRHRR